MRNATALTCAGLFAWATASDAVAQSSDCEAVIDLANISIDLWLVEDGDGSSRNGAVMEEIIVRGGESRDSGRIRFEFFEAEDEQGDVIIEAVNWGFSPVGHWDVDFRQYVSQGSAAFSIDLEVDGVKIFQHAIFADAQGGAVPVGDIEYGRNAADLFEALMNGSSLKATWFALDNPNNLPVREWTQTFDLSHLKAAYARVEGALAHQMQRHRLGECDLI